jgi:hypothetical protein
VRCCPKVRSGESGATDLRKTLIEERVDAGRIESSNLTVENHIVGLIYMRPEKLEVATRNAVVGVCKVPALVRRSVHDQLAAIRKRILNSGNDSWLFGDTHSNWVCSVSGQVGVYVKRNHMNAKRNVAGLQNVDRCNDVSWVRCGADVLQSNDRPVSIGSNPKVIKQQIGQNEVSIGL